MFPVLDASCDKPAMVKMIKVIISDGMVVNSKYRMCEKIGLPVTDAAKTVVSESGETLSPKYAPEMIAPAIQPVSKPCASPIPIKAIPIVAMVVQELPVITDTIQQIRLVDTKKKLGWMIWIP